MAGGPQNFYVRSVQIGEREFQDGTVEIGGPREQEMLIELGSDGAEVAGVVSDEKNVVGRARVFLLAENSSFCTIADSAVTSEDGSFVIRGIGPGPYKLLAVNEKGKPVYLADEVLELDRNLIEEIDVRAGERVTQDLRIGEP
jgi:hypothetical protein